MKIKKALAKSIRHIEALENEFIDPAEQPLDEICDSEDCSGQETVEESIDLADDKDRQALSQLALDILKGAQKDFKTDATEVTNKAADAAEEIADDTWKAEDLVPVSKTVTSNSAAVKGLNRALSTAIRQKRTGTDRDYPNVIFSGLAGFGKTAIVREFCKEHHLNLFECDAKSLDVATVGGIPYPVKDSKGELKQMPIASQYWERLSLPNTVLFLDEFNRAADNISGTLLDLINSHNLPITHQVNGKYKTIKHFDNILFTVMAINPASNAFSNVSEFTPEKVGRGTIFINFVANRLELLDHLRKVYKTILANPYLEEEDHEVYEGQLNIAEALLTNKAFMFDDKDDVERIHMDNNSKGYLTQFLSYRTLTTALQACDGTKADFLAGLYYYQFSDARQTMIKNILQNYTDKPTKGNSVFTKAQQQAASLATAAQKASIGAATKQTLSAFADSLGDD